MKRLAGILIFCLSTLQIRAQNAPESKSAEQLAFKEKSFDFGSIQQGRPVTHIFQVTNTTNTPIRLETVQASCGCTTPVWSREPIAPGATADIKVGYNAAALGNFHKSVSITYEGGHVKAILISGTVYQAPPGSAPANASIALLNHVNQ